MTKLKTSIAQLTEKIRGQDDPSQKMACLKDQFRGDRCFVLTCGPSLRNHSTSELQSLLKDEVVLAVKQAYNLFPEIIDIHLLNSWNWQPYDYTARHPIVFMERLDDDPPSPGLNADFVFGLKYPHDKTRQLAVTHDFDDFTFDKGTDRPWGPGIMYEFGFYLPMYMGFTEIIVLGWDLGELNSTKMDHFFDQEHPDQLGYKQDNEILHNKPRIIPEEVKRIADSTGCMYRWLQAKGVNIKIVSDRSLLDPIIPRITLRDCYDN